MVWDCLRGLQFWLPSKIHTLAIPGWHILHWAASHDASEKSVAVVLQACGHHKGTRAAYWCPNIQPKYCTWHWATSLLQHKRQVQKQVLWFYGGCQSTPSPPNMPPHTNEALLRVNHCFPLERPSEPLFLGGYVRGRPAISQAYQLDRVLIC